MQSRQAKAVETFGYRVLFGQQTRWIKASDFIVHQLMDGSFKLQYAPKEKVADLRLMAGPRGSILVRGDRQATSLREGRPDRQGYAAPHMCCGRVDDCGTFMDIPGAFSHEPARRPLGLPGCLEPVRLHLADLS